MVDCSGACGDKVCGKKGQSGVGLATRESITRAVVRPPKPINERLLKATLTLHGRASAVSFVVVYGVTDVRVTRAKNRAFWAALDRAVKEVPKHEQLFVLMDANARTGRRGCGRPGNEHCGALGAHGRDTGNDNGEFLLAFASNHDLALVNAFFSNPQNGISHTFNGAGNRKRIDYILTRQRDRKLVRNVVVHHQPSCLPISDYNAVVAHVRLLGRFARNRQVRRDIKPSLDRR